MEINVKFDTEKIQDIKNLMKMLGELMPPEESCEVCVGVEGEDAEINTPKITAEQIQAVLIELIKTVGTSEVKKLLKEFGVDKVSELPPSDYERFLSKAMEVENGAR